MKDRVSWRRAWSLFYKVMIMQTIFTLMIWSGIAYKWDTPFNDSEDDYAKFDECFTEKLLNNGDISKCDKYSPD